MGAVVWLTPFENRIDALSKGSRVHMFFSASHFTQGGSGDGSFIRDSILLGPVWLTGMLKMERTDFIICSVVALSGHDLRLCHLFG